MFKKLPVIDEGLEKCIHLGSNLDYEYFEFRKKGVYLYFVYNQATGVLKIGISSQPVGRVRVHLSNFKNYGNSKPEDLFYGISKLPVIPARLVEKRILNYFSYFNIGKRIAEEFFLVESRNIDLIIKYFNYFVFHYSKPMKYQIHWPQVDETIKKPAKKAARPRFNT